MEGVDERRHDLNEPSRLYAIERVDEMILCVANLIYGRHIPSNLRSIFVQFLGHKILMKFWAEILRNPVNCPYFQSKLKNYVIREFEPMNIFYPIMPHILLPPTPKIFLPHK